jgi:hypothetical protein
MISFLSKTIIGITLFFLGFYSGQQFEVEKNQTCRDTKSCVSTLLPQQTENQTTPNTIIDEEQAKLDITEPVIVQKVVSLVIDFGDNNIKSFDNIEINDNTTVFDILKKITTENNLDLKYSQSGGLGAFIESINGSKNNFKENKFWQYWVNNKFALVGAGGYVLKDGDVVEWKYIGQTSF